MLEPQTRTLLLDALRPPDGHQLDYGVGTTFSLDLITLLTAPLAFTWFDRGRGEEELSADALEVLESLRRYANRLAVFCHAGRISLPRSRPPQLAFLEQTVFECLPPNGGIFHPKAWVLRFTGESNSVIYRFLCLSRNLTFSRSWDTILSLEGSRGTRIYRRNEPLGSFLNSPPALTVRELPEAVRRRIAVLAEEVKSVDFLPPDDIEQFRFWPLGINNQVNWPFRDLGSKTIVISPFTGSDMLERLSSGRPGHVLISTPESLAALDRKPIGYDEFWVLSENASAEPEDGADVEQDLAGDDRGEGSELSGLHAKCYVTEEGATSHIWTGSANATGAAFERNVEFLVQLTGPKRLFGFERLLCEGKDKDEVRFRDLLERADDMVAREQPDREEEQRRAWLEHARSALAATRFVVDVKAQEGDRYDLTLRSTNPKPPMLPEQVSVECWPITLSDQWAKLIEPAAMLCTTFEHVTFEALTAFFAFRVTVADGHMLPASVFVLHAPLQNAPENRTARILRSLVSDRGRLVQFISLLLADEGLDAGLLDIGITGTLEPNEQHRPQWTGSAGLLESLVRALDKAPERLDDVARLIADLADTADRESLFPEGFHCIWGPIWAARERMRRCQRN